MKRSSSIVILMIIATLLTGCPLLAPESGQGGSSPADESDAGGGGGNPGGGSSSSEQDAGTTSPDDGSASNDQIDPDFLMTDPIDWFFLRVFKRRFFRHGMEYFPDQEKPHKRVYTPTEKHLRFFNAIALVKLFVTNLQERRGGSGLSGLLRLLFPDFEAQALYVNVKSVEVRAVDSSTWVKVKDFGSSGEVFDFVNLHEGGILQIGEFDIAPGAYDRMRLKLGSGHKLVADFGSGPVQESLNASNNIELVSTFEVPHEGPTSILVDFDLKESVRCVVILGCWLMPKMRIIGAVTGTPASSLISAEEGGMVEILDQIRLIVPPGALDEDTQVTVRALNHLLPHETPDLVLLGQEFVIEPDGLNLNVPAQLTLFYDQAHVDALGVDPDGLDLFGRQTGTRTWAGLGGLVSSEFTAIEAEISTFGRFGIGGSPLVSVEGLGCEGYSDAVAIAPTELGIDTQIFGEACNHKERCYQHGGRTYGKTADQCLDEMFAGMSARCEALCQAGFGKDCALLDDEDRTSDAGTLVATLYDNCLAVASRMYQEDVSKKDTQYPPLTAQTCSDYEGLGVSCAPPTCTLTVDPEAIPIDTPTDIRFSLTFQGSIYTVEFDGSNVYTHDGLALPISQSIEILEEGRSLSAQKVYSATVIGPSNTPGTCSVTVDVIEEPDPCRLVITPDTISPGQTVNIFATVLPGYNTAFFDTRTEGTLHQVGLSPPDAAGNRYFSTNVTPTASRSYTARVVHDDGHDFYCSATVTVVP